MTQYAATLLSLAGLYFIRKKDPLGPLLGLAGSLAWVLYAVDTAQFGLVATELAFVGAYASIIVEWREP